MVGIDQPQVQPAGERRGDNLRRPGRHEREHRVEEVVVDDLDATGTKSGGKADRVVVHPLGDRGQAVGTVMDGVHRRQHRRQHLRRADVAGRLLPADVLLPGLDGEPVGTMAVGVHRHTDKPARKRPLQTVTDGDETGMRAAEAQAQAEPLRAADRDVRTELARRGEQGQRQRIDRDRDDDPAVARLLDHGSRVPQSALGTGIGEQDAERRLGEVLGKDG